jgi:hypothetical protein
MTATVPTVRQLLAYWVGRTLPGTDRAPALDAGEPSCFACGWFNEDTLDPLVGSGLERAHAVPRSIGGSNEPSNLALLCKHCHLEAPDTADAAWFWRWIAGHPSDGYPVNRAAERMLAAVALMSPEHIEVLSRVDRARTPELLEEAAVAVQPVLHAGRLSAATTARLMTEMAELLERSAGQLALEI